MRTLCVTYPLIIHRRSRFSLFTFVFPLALLLYVYTRIGLFMWRREVPGNVYTSRDHHQAAHNMRSKVIKMLFVVLGIFLVCWLPLQTLALIMRFKPNFLMKNFTFTMRFYTNYACVWLTIAHGCFNPMIYCFMNNKFRSGLKDLFCNCCRGRTSSRVSNLQPATGGALIGIGMSRHVQLPRSSPRALYSTASKGQLRLARIQVIGDDGTPMPPQTGHGLSPASNGDITKHPPDAHKSNSLTLRCQSVVCLHESLSVGTGSDLLTHVTRQQQQQQPLVDIFTEHRLVVQQRDCRVRNALAQPPAVIDNNNKEKENRVAVGPLGAMTDKSSIANV